MHASGVAALPVDRRAVRLVDLVHRSQGSRDPDVREVRGSYSEPRVTSERVPEPSYDIHFVHDEAMTLSWADSVVPLRVVCNTVQLQERFDAWFEHQWFLPYENVVDAQGRAPRLLGMTVYLVPYYFAECHATLSYCMMTETLPPSLSSSSLSDPLTVLDAVLQELSSSGVSASNTRIQRGIFEHHAKLSVLGACFTSLPVERGRSPHGWSEAFEHVDLNHVSRIHGGASAGHWLISLTHQALGLDMQEDEQSHGVSVHTVPVDMTSINSPWELERRMEAKASKVSRAELKHSLMQQQEQREYRQNQRRAPRPRRGQEDCLLPLDGPEDRSAFKLSVEEESYAFLNVERVLLPFWSAQYQDRTGKTYQVWVNASTGAIAAQRAWHWMRILKVSLVALSVVATATIVARCLRSEDRRGLIDRP
ncbi:hypothetical protein FVE85_2895 [Porphyridium purpureum]|uniref:Uncharacterized protein n=1 Tax=Porphyridium purpureum TaxID=35688 RepID=A0A5J4YVC2_PORPP|nr:hypothetical protein FVE85_2895 [Porphyridium purpureum]|eukprot:POR6805..scf227_4